MAVTSVTTAMAGAINYTVVTDTSADWASVANSTYFYDKTDKLVHYKDSTGNIQEIFSGSGITVGTTPSTGTNGRVFFQAGGVVQQDANFTFDNTLKRLTLKAVNTAATDIPFAVQSSASSSNLFSIRGDQAIEMIATTPSTNGGILITKTDNYNSPRIQLYNIFAQLTDINGSTISTSNLKSGSSGAAGYMGIVNTTSQDRFLKFINLFGNETLSIGGNNYDGAATFTMKSWAGTSPGNIFTIIKSDNTNPFVITDTARVGVGTNSPQSRLDVRAADGLSNPVFRVRNSVDTSNIVNFNGNGQFAIGLGASVNSTSVPEYSVVIGHNASDGAAGNRTASIAIGRLASGNYYGVAIGTQSTSSGDAGVAIGASATASTNGSALGYQATAAGGGVSIGKLASSSNQGAITIGTNTINNQNYSVVFNSSLQVITNEHSNVCKMYFNSTKQSFFYHENGRFVINSKVDLVANTNYDNTATNTVTITNGTIPTLNIVDSFQQYSADITAGNAAPHFRTELGDIIKLYKNAAVTTPQGIADALTNLGVLTASTIAPSVQSVVSAATVTPVNGNDLVVITAQAAALTLANPTGTWAEGQDLMIRIKDDGLGARAITWDTNYRAIGVTLPTTTVINKTTYVGIIYNSTDGKWDVIGVTTEA